MLFQWLILHLQRERERERERERDRATEQEGEGEIEAAESLQGWSQVWIALHSITEMI